MIADAIDTTCAGVKMKSLVVWSCFTSPFTRQISLRLLTSMSVTIHGPIGAKVSNILPSIMIGILNAPGVSKSAAQTSFTQV